MFIKPNNRIKCYPFNETSADCVVINVYLLFQLHYNPMELLPFTAYLASKLSILNIINVIVSFWLSARIGTISFNFLEICAISSELANNEYNTKEKQNEAIVYDRISKKYLLNTMELSTRRHNF